MNNIRENVLKSTKLRNDIKKGRTIQDISILLFVVSMFVSAVIMLMAAESVRIPQVVMFIASCFSILLAAYSYRYIAVMSAGTEILVFTVYMLFQHHSNGLEIHWTCYVWLFLPIIFVATMLLYRSLGYKMEINNDILATQMENLVLIHPLTGLYNLRSLYIDLERQMAYAKRNNLCITLLCIQLRYARELQSMLTASQFDQLQQTLARCTEDALRVEDRVYSVDDQGSLSAILTCDAHGALIVKNRIKSKVQNTNEFYDGNSRALRIDLRIAYLQYDPENISNAIEFRQKAENELQYDV